MRTLYITALTLLLTCGLSAQVVFESNFANWTANMPDDWGGSKTSLEVDSVAQSADAPQYGDFLVELTNFQSSHKRFTSQGVSLEEGIAYEVEVWVKGEGQIRTNLWDGDLDGGDFGYGNYNSYVDVTGGTLTSFVQTVVPDTTSDEQQIILSLRNGSILVDRVEVREGEPVVTTPATIYEVQYTEDASGDSPFLDQPVATGGVVTGVLTSGYWLQDGTGAWNGVYVYAPGHSALIGDEVTMEADVVEYFNLTELSDPTEIILVGQAALPAATNDGTMALNDEMYEGVLVITQGECMTIPDADGRWLLNDGTGDIVIDDKMYAFTPEVGQWYAVTGPMDYSFSEYRIQPRDAEDISLASALEDFVQMEVSVFPNPTSDYVNVNSEEFIGGTVMVIDALGKEVLAQRVENSMTVLDVSDLRSGQYQVNLSKENSRGTASVIIK
jgi:hypothetical protein